MEVKGAETNTNNTKSLDGSSNVRPKRRTTTSSSSSRLANWLLMLRCNWRLRPRVVSSQIGESPANRLSLCGPYLQVTYCRQVNYSRNRRNNNNTLTVSRKLWLLCLLFSKGKMVAFEFERSSLCSLSTLEGIEAESRKLLRAFERKFLIQSEVKVRQKLANAIEFTLRVANQIQ